MSELRVNRILNHAGDENHFTMSTTKLVVGADVNSVNEICGIICPPVVTIDSSRSSGKNRLRSSVSFINATPTTITDSYTTNSGMNQYYMVDTSVQRTFILPNGVNVGVGDWITIVDVGTGESNAGNASKKPITVQPNVADRIQGGTAGDTFIIDIDGQSVTLMWCGSTYDWRIVSI